MIIEIKSMYFAAQMLHLKCLFRIELLKYGCAFKWVHVCMYILCMYMYVYIEVYVIRFLESSSRFPSKMEMMCISCYLVFKNIVFTNIFGPANIFKELWKLNKSDFNRKKLMIEHVTTESPPKSIKSSQNGNRRSSPIF